jgi:phage tail sheath protein FI
MPTTYVNTPGVQIQEVRLGSPPIVGVSTSIAGFVGQAPTITGNPQPAGGQYVNIARPTTSADQFIKEYIGLPPDPVATLSTPLSRAVLGFFANGGTKCYVVNVASATDTDVIAGLKLLEVIDEVAIIAAPGHIETTVYQELEDQCFRTGDRFALLDPPANPADPLNPTMPPASDYAAFYYPTILVGKDLADDPDPTGPTPAYVTPIGHIAGVYASVDTNKGVHKAPANEVLRGAIGVKAALTDAQQNSLNPLGVNVLRMFSGNVVVWGARTVSTDVTWRYVNVRRLVNYVEESLQEGLRWAVFEPNNLTLRKQITRSVRAFLDGVWRDGALFGATADEAYYVRFPDSFNSDDDRAQGKLTMEIGLRVTYPAEFIIIRIGLLMQSAATA